MTVRPAAQAGDPAEVTLTPGSGLTIVNRVATGRSRITPTTSTIAGRLDQPVLVVTGSIAAGAAALDRTVAVVNPTVFFAQSLKDGLSRAASR